MAGGDVVSIEVHDVGHGIVKVRDSSWPESSGCPLPAAEWAAHVAAERVVGYEAAIAKLRDRGFNGAADYLEATKGTTL